ncbi:MAG: EAL domain-containing protein, partial [Alphaproteobacteria bacterium]|nr:EAL domain-containing protein [Alphaproteobacteria bacterium]
LAFCSADLLLELDSSAEITFAAGATNVFTGRSPEDLRGVRMHELVHESDKRKLERLLRDARAGTRIDDASLTLTTASGHPIVLSVSGFHMSDLGGHTYLSFRVRMQASTYADEDAVRVEGMEVYDKGSFTEAATKALADAEAAGEQRKLTMIELGAYDELRTRLSEDAQNELSATMGSFFRASSVGGDLAGQIDENRFGLVHDVSLDVESLSGQIQDYARSLDPEGEGLSVESATIDVDPGVMTEADTAKALVYTINRFCDETSGEFTVRDLSESFSSMASETVERRNKFVEMINQGAFDVAFQPICDMQTGRPHHFEALVRFDHENFEASPFEFITFAEEVGIICDFDLAMCRKVLGWLDDTNGQGYRYMTAVNISGRSLSTPKFVRKLIDLLAEHPDAREHILFEITESAKLTDLDEANKIIQALRSAGHIVCLDDFGAGVSAFQYLSALHVDVVKIDGAYVVDALTNKRNRALLRAMASMCRELDIKTVAEMIEDEETATLVRDSGIDYGQGYLYGRPSKLITAFQSPRPKSFPREKSAA